MGRWLCLCFLVACGSDGGGDDTTDPPEPIGGARTITGEVVDFQTGDAVGGNATVSTSGVIPPPSVETEGASFTIEGVPDNSIFQIQSEVATTHRSTFGPSVEVLTNDLANVKTPAVSEAFLSATAAGFGATVAVNKGVLILELVDEDGAPKTAVPGGQLIVAGGVDGPHFLDANLDPDDAANQSSASGYAVFFDVPAGLVELGVAAQPTVSLTMSASPITANTVTIARVVVADGPPMPPVDVKFARDIVPIFTARGCVACHTGGGIGKDLGGLKLDGPAQQVYSELMEDPTRVVTGTPLTSLVLTRPARENPPDVHPNVTFASSADPDFQKLLAWITDGAQEN